MESNLNKYFDDIIEHLREKKILVKWNKNGFAVNVVDNSLFNDIDSEGKKEFVEVLFKLLRNLIQYIDGENVKEYEPYVIQLIEKLPHIKENLLVYKHSNSYLLEEYDYEILTKRNKDDIKEIIDYSVLINLKATQSTGGDKTKSLTFDITAHDLGDLISVLNKAKCQVDELRGLRD